ncbi:MAG: putative trifunctional 2-polyprenylphenol hydroxylase/glutamate synthase subunit beta/ferritin domain-containing protein [Deltaproteobacteria bacterium ADurb.Bin207]|nr:MAG: putative trifunctional 2-polyprenylphenol hydroxylase/glutamate synthase subunit beta/ferritin domain-containing protein [Deltaproteobacteria bacterium ADurb.Bin207]
MENLSIEQALRNAVEAELAAARFYSRLAEHTTDPTARRLVQQLHDDELKHAAAIELMSRRLGKVLPVHATDGYAMVEIEHEWDLDSNINYLSVLERAIAAERKASRFYGTLATAFTGEARSFFDELSMVEELHANRLLKLLEKARG